MAEPTIYIAASFSRKDDVSRLYAAFGKAGLKPSYDWTTHLRIIPFSQNIARAAQYTREDIDGVRNADVFLLLAQPGGGGRYVELGAAIGNRLAFGKPEIYVVQEGEPDCMFYLHPQAVLMPKLEDVVEDLLRKRIILSRPEICALQPQQ